MTITAGITFYSLVLFVHIAAAVLAFGVTFVYGMVVPWTAKQYPQHLGYFHRVQNLLSTKWIPWTGGVLLLAGLYMAIDGPYDFGEWWVGLGLLIILVLLGMAGAFFAPRERKLAELAEREFAAAPAGGGGAAPQPSEEYQRLTKQSIVGGIFANALTLLAIFAMVMGSRGYLS